MTSSRKVRRNKIVANARIAAINLRGAVKIGTMAIAIEIAIIKQGTTNHPTAITSKWVPGYDILAVLPARGVLLVMVVNTNSCLPYLDCSSQFPNERRGRTSNSNIITCHHERQHIIHLHQRVLIITVLSSFVTTIESRSKYNSNVCERSSIDSIPVAITITAITVGRNPVQFQ